MYYKDGKTYGSITAIRNEMKEVSLPVIITDEMLAEMGYLVVVDSVKPEATDVQNVVQGAIEVIDGAPTQQYVVQDMFSDTEEYTDMEGVVHPAKTKAEYEAEYREAQRKALIPQSLTPRQARLVLLQNGILDDIETMVATDRAMGIWWEYSLEIVRDNEHIVNAGVALGLTSEQLDQMFIDGSVL